MPDLRLVLRFIAFAALVALSAFGIVASWLETARFDAGVMVEGGVLTVAPQSEAEASGLHTGDRVLALDGVPVFDSRRLDGGFAGLMGDSLQLDVARGDRTFSTRIVLGALESGYAQALGISYRVMERVSLALTTGALLSFILVGGFLFLRERGRGYRAGLGIAFVSFGGGLALYSGQPWIDTHAPVLMLIGFLLLELSLPVVTYALAHFPDGETVPWARRLHWVTGGLSALTIVLGVVGFISGWETLEDITDPLMTVTYVVAFTLPLGAVSYRYVKTSDTEFRQQIKWIALPLFGAILILISGNIVLPIALGPSISLGGYIITATNNLAATMMFAAIPLGVLASVFRFRPWDADVWIWRSLAGGIATLGVAVVFAVGTKSFNALLESGLGVTSGATSAALSAITSVVMFAPLKTRMTAFVEREHLRVKRVLETRLPAFLTGRQAVSTSGDVGAAVLRYVGEALAPARTALLAVQPDASYVAVAASGVSVDDAEAWAATAGDVPKKPTQEWSDPVFVLRIPLRSSEGAPVGMLVLGTHRNGRGYSTDAQKALKGIGEPVAEALVVAASRAVEMERLDRLEAYLAERRDALPALL